MKTTLDLRDEILEDAKRTAAIRGETLSDYVAGAVETRLQRDSKRTRPKAGWRSVFGVARRADVTAIDQIIERDLETVEWVSW